MFWSKNKKNGYTPAYPSFTTLDVYLFGIFFLLMLFQVLKVSSANTSGPPLALGTNVPGDAGGGSWRSFM